MADTLGTIECVIDNCLIGLDGSLMLSLRADKSETTSVRKIYDIYNASRTDPNKRLTAQFVWHKEKRSLNANAYFHVLVGKIAKATQQSETEIKQQFVFDYGVQLGALILESDILPEKAGVEYARQVNEFNSPKGKPCIQYMIYKQTHTLDTAEMARLIDGAVSEAQQLGIETKTPEELEKIKALWAGQ